MRRGNRVMDAIDVFMVFSILVVFIFTIAFTEGARRREAAEQTAIEEAIEEFIPEVPETVTKFTQKEMPERPKVIEWVGTDELPLTNEEQRQLFDICYEYNVPMAYALAVIETESAFDREALGGVGEVGLFQVHPIWWDSMENLRINVHTVKGNMEAGVLILAENINAFKDLDAATMGYKCGISRAKELISDGVFLDACQKVKDRTEYYEGILQGVGYVER